MLDYKIANAASRQGALVEFNTKVKVYIIYNNIHKF